MKSGMLLARGAASAGWQKNVDLYEPTEEAASWRSPDLRRDTRPQEKEMDSFLPIGAQRSLLGELW